MRAAIRSAAHEKGARNADSSNRPPHHPAAKPTGIRLYRRDGKVAMALNRFALRPCSAPPRRRRSAMNVPRPGAKLFALDEVFPDASNYARRDVAPLGSFLPVSLPAAVDAMMATLRDVGVESFRASSATANAAKSRCGGPFVRRLTRLILAFLAAVAVTVGSAAAQAVPVPDPEPQPLPPPTQATTPLPPAPVVKAPAVKAPAVKAPAGPAPTAPVHSSPPPTSASSQPGSGRFGLLLHDGTYLVGVFGETKAVPFEAVFGNIEIPLASIKVVDFAVVVNGTKTHRVQFINGDMLTGNVGHVEPMKFQTSYGTMTVPMEMMLRMSGNAPAAELAPQTPNGPTGGKDEPKPDGTAQVLVTPQEPPGPIRPPRAVPVPDDLVE